MRPVGGVVVVFAENNIRGNIVLDIELWRVVAVLLVMDIFRAKRLFKFERSTDVAEQYPAVPVPH